MQKTLLITGATDGIGLALARQLAPEGHHLLLHGRNPSKLEGVAQEIAALGAARVETFQADLSRPGQVSALSDALSAQERLDVLIHNAGVFHSPQPVTAEGLDVRFAVNTIAPYRLTQRLLPQLAPDARVVNLSSAAQSPVDLAALRGERRLEENPAYAQSKLAVTMWSCHLGRTLGPDGPSIVAVNPGSLLATKMVHQAFGVAGSDVRIGADILQRAALAEDFGHAASGKYFDNDSGRFAAPHPEALDSDRCVALVQVLESFVP